MIKIYLARGMSGRIKADVVKEAKKDRKVLLGYGFQPLCPVLSEGVQNKKETLLASKEQMDTYWYRDKEMIRNSHVVFDMTPHLNSEGVKHELGFARYALWKPVIRVFPKGHIPPLSSVSFYEDDFITDDLRFAAKYVNLYYGSWYKRVIWRIKLLNKSLPKFIYQQLREFWL